MLQTVALLVVVAYYQHAGTRERLGNLTRLRSELGVIFPMLTTALFGAVIPWLYLRFQRDAGARQTARQGLVMTLFWFYKGFEVDLLYRTLARFVGEQNNIGTIVTKACIDQFVYCPLFAVPTTWAIYTWVESRFDTRSLWQEFRARGWYGRSVTPVLISNVGVWLPAVALIYALPTALQLPMQNFVLCFFTLMMATLARRRRQHAG